MTPYKALYGQPPPQHLPYLAGSSKVECMDQSFTLFTVEEVIRVFQVGDLVYLKFQPYWQQSIKKIFNQKFALKKSGILTSITSRFSNPPYLPCVLAQTTCRTIVGSTHSKCNGPQWSYLKGTYSYLGQKHGLKRQPGRHRSVD
ncbi:Retrotransposable element Tf2 [Gossypium australe]|uniref:Retrotransposable element Tf2 n=1 Tax=Gossypium australe TaxID=47621 RepID=A0A5B6VLX6_9ROSI|nr:Retrotransposable element Tf2 [Gossypium australe]